jgi:hypothetical protein
MSQTETQLVDTRPPETVRSFQIVPLSSEKPIMRLDPDEEKVFHGDCFLLCIEGGAHLSNPLSETICIKGDHNNVPNGKNKYYLDVMLCNIRAGKSGLEFSLQRPKLY